MVDSSAEHPDHAPQTGPAASPPALSASELAEARAYHRRQLVCDVTGRLLDVVFLVIFTLWVARPLDTWFESLPLLDNRWWRLAAMFLALAAAHLCVSLPLAFYAGHVLEHRFGLSRQSLAGWCGRTAKRQSLGLVFGLAMVQVLYLVVWLTGPYWWLAAAAAFFLVSILLGQLVPVLILPLFYKITRLDDAELAERLARLTAGTGLTIEGVYRMQLSDETVKANAMLTGLGRTRRVILGDTLLDGFSADEISVVFAHEVGHHVCRHIPKLILAGLGFSAASFFVCDRLLALWIEGGGGSAAYTNLPVYALPFFMLTITLFSFVLEPLANGMSRRFERQADRYALQSTGLVAAYRSAFTKLARRNKADPDPYPLEVILFHSHPPIAQRLATADEFGPA